MKVTYVDSMGSDISVVNAARVSFSKKSEYEKDTKKLSAKDVKLIDYLADHGHWSPFAHTSIQFQIKAPIFVARQLAKHQTGGVWNEISRRYVDYEPEFYWPEKWRGRPVDKKQGSSDNEVTEIDWRSTEGELTKISIDHVVKFAIGGGGEYPQQASILNLYKSMIEAGVAPEQARMILPQNMYTEWYWTGSLYFFARVCSLRLSKDAQEETRFIASQISDICHDKFPISWTSLNVED